MMYHPQPQHPSPNRTLNSHSYEAYRGPYSFSRSATSDVRGFGPLSPTPMPSGGSDMLVESPQYAYPPQALDHPSSHVSSPTRYPTSTHGTFQSSFDQFPSRPPPQSPTYALRPARPNNVFSHIEHPANSSGDSIDPASSDEEDDYWKQSVTPQRPHRNVLASTLQTSYSYDYNTPYGSGVQDSFIDDARSQMNRGPSQTKANSYGVSHPPPVPVEPESPVGTLRPVANHRTRTRGRNGSDSSISSALSSSAVVGETIYRTDTVYDTFGARLNKRANGQFQPQSVPDAYPRGYAGSEPQVSDSAHRAVGSPYFSLDPQNSEKDGDRPFVYQGTNWDYPLRGLVSVAAPSTNVDAMSLDGRDPARRSSSRGSSVDRRNKKDKRGVQAPEPSATGGEGKKKSVMACHFCRYRKLRCDGGIPCGHCEKRGKECTYDAAIRRRGPGRKNKSAKETAQVQLAQRQREEAEREAKLQDTKAQEHDSIVVLVPTEKRDFSMQTSPQVAQYPSATSQGGPYYGASSNWHIDLSPSQSVRSPGIAESPSRQPAAPSMDKVGPSFSSFADFRTEFRPPQDSPPYSQERQAFVMPFQPERPGVLGPYPASLATQQYSHQHQESSQDRSAYGPQTPASATSSVFYEDNRERRNGPSHGRQAHQYATSGYGQGPAHEPGRYQRSVHSDVDSVYAYSEGANVVPSRHEGRARIPLPARSDIQVPRAVDVIELPHPEDDARGSSRDWKQPRDTTRR